MSKQRIVYIDIAKGILILFLLMGHALLFIKHEGVDDVFINGFQKCRLYLWTGFYMPAFFVITGYCTSFDKPFLPFLWKNIKTLKIPAILFGTFLALVTMFSHHNLTTPNVTNHVVWCFLDSGLWFLDALFISKLCYWGFQRVTNNKFLLFMACLVLFAIGYLWYYEQEGDFTNVKHAFMLTFFLFFGQELKTKDNKLHLKGYRYIPLLIYILTICCVIWGNLPFPYITNKIHLSMSSLLPFFLLSTTGSIWVLQLSKTIEPNSILKYIGKNSLVFYIFNTFALNISVTLLSKYMTTTMNCVLLYIGTIVLTCCILTLITIILNTKYLKFTLGKNW